MIAEKRKLLFSIVALVRVRVRVRVRYRTGSVVPQVRSPQYPQSAVRVAQYAAKDPPFCGYCG